MKLNIPTTLAFALIFVFSSGFAQDFCSNLNIIHNDVAFNESFTNCRGDQTSQTKTGYGDTEMITTEYATSQELIPGNPGKIIFQDYPGITDFWTYQVTTSIVYDKDGQLEIAEYWFETIKSCLAKDTSWTYEITERSYDSDEKVKIWKASKPIGTHFGFVHKSISVFVYEERDENLRKTGRFGVRIEIM